MLEIAFGLGLALGVVRERGYEAVEKGMGLREAAVHIVSGFGTEARFAQRTIRSLFVRAKPTAEKVAGEIRNATEAVRLVQGAVEGASRAEALVPLAE